MPDAQTGTLKRDARQMRRAPTPAESRLWLHLRDRRLAGFKFRRQVPLGNYIADFYCHEARLVVELDGGQHAEAAPRARDAERTSWLEGRGVHVLRFWNGEALRSTETVLEVIDRELRSRARQGREPAADSPHPNPLPEGEPAAHSPHPDPLPEGEGEVRKDASHA